MHRSIAFNTQEICWDLDVSDLNLVLEFSTMLLSFTVGHLAKQVFRDVRRYSRACRQNACSGTVKPLCREQSILIEKMRDLLQKTRYVYQNSRTNR